MRVFLGLFIAAVATTVSGFAVPGSSILSARQDGYPGTYYARFHFPPPQL